MITKAIIIISILYIAFMSIYWATGGTHKDAINDTKDIIKFIKNKLSKMRN